MSKYEIIIYWSKEGETYQKALANAEIIIQEWIETARELGRQIPEPNVLTK